MSYSLARHLLRTLELAAAAQPASIRVLDFGCGAGGLVYEFRDAGYEAFGFDLHDSVCYRSETDREIFRFFDNGSSDTSNQNLRDGFRIPFPDGYFDLVVSTSVIEHVMDLPAVNREIARVTNKRGHVLHTYPHRLVPIEPHTYIPLGGLISWRPWIWLWCQLGVRNESYEGHTAARTFLEHSRYFREGLAYRSRSKLHRIIARDFRHVRDVSREWLGDFTPPSLWQLIKEARKQRYPFRYIAPRIPLKAVMASTSASPSLAQE